MKFLHNFLLCGTALLLVGCSAPQPSPVLHSRLPNSYLMFSHGNLAHGSLAAQTLVNQTQKKLNLDSTIIVASFVDINDVTQSSTLGRMLSQQFASQFTHNSYNVIELLLRNNIYIAEKSGEFLLSREIKNISSQHAAQAVIVGTYATGVDTVFITAKVIDVASNIILSSVHFSIPLDPNVKQMLSD